MPARTNITKPSTWLRGFWRTIADKFDNHDTSLDAIEADNWITSARIASSAVTTAKIADSAVTTAKIADLNVTAAKIANTTITNAQLASKTVTYAKMAIAVSTEITANGSPQNFTHGLGATPSQVFVVPTDTSASTAGVFVVTEGAHDGTNAIVSVTSGKKYKVIAIA